MAVHLLQAISACEKGGEWKHCLTLLESVRAAGLQAGLSTFNAAISACEKGGQWQPALELLKELKARRIQPDLVTFSAAISAMEKGGQGSYAYDLISDMKKTGLSPDERCYRAAISACGKAALWKPARALLVEMPTRNFTPAIDSVNAAVSSASADASWEYVITLEEMKGRGATAQPNSQKELAVAQGFGAASSGAALEPTLPARPRSLTTFAENTERQAGRPRNAVVDRATSMCDDRFKLTTFEKSDVVRQLLTEVVSEDALLQACCQIGEDDDATDASLVSVSALSVHPKPMNARTRSVDDSCWQSFLLSRQLKKLVDLFEPLEVPVGADIKRGGEEADSLFVIESGEVRVISLAEDGTEQGILAVIGEGNTFGQLAMMYNAPSAVTFRALSACSLWSLSRVTFRQVWT